MASKQFFLKSFSISLILILLAVGFLSPGLGLAQGVDLEPGSVRDWTEDIPPGMDVHAVDIDPEPALDGYYMTIRDQDGNIEYIPLPEPEERHTPAEDAEPLIPAMLGPKIPVSRPARGDRQPDVDRGSRIVKPVDASFPIADTSTFEYNPSIAHGGNRYMVVYSKNGHIYASVHANNGTQLNTFLVDNWHDDFNVPRVAYERNSGLFVVAYHRRPPSQGVWYTAVSPNSGQIGVYFGHYTGGNHYRPAVLCTYPTLCIIVYERNQNIEGSYFWVNSGGLHSAWPPESFANLQGLRPFLAYDGATTALLAFTWTNIHGWEFPVYTHIWAQKTGGLAYTHPAVYAHDFNDPDYPSWQNSDKYATGVAYDPCTQKYMLVYDHDYGFGIFDIWGAVIDQFEPSTHWNGDLAYMEEVEKSGGISFVTAPGSPAVCGVMDKLVMTYTNWDTEEIYAVEIVGNNDPTNPAYVRDPDDDQFIVAQLPGAPFWRPAISGGPSQGQLLIAYNEVRSGPLNFNVWGRLVHVRANYFLPLIVR